MINKISELFEKFLNILGKIWDFIKSFCFHSIFSSIITIIVCISIIIGIFRKIRNKLDSKVTPKNPQDNYCFFRKTYKGQDVIVFCYCNLLFPVLKVSDKKSNFYYRLIDWKKYGFNEEYAIFSFGYYYNFKKFMGSRRQIENGYLFKMTDADIEVFNEFFKILTCNDFDNSSLIFWSRNNLKKAELTTFLSMEDYTNYIRTQKRISKRQQDEVIELHKKTIEEYSDFIWW